MADKQGGTGSTRRHLNVLDYGQVSMVLGVEELRVEHNRRFSGQNVAKVAQPLLEGI
jgi:hypothetical protein